MTVDRNHSSLVSVLTPCFNSCEYLESCIQSVLDQNYPHVEMIVQDGASEDGTIEILQRYKDQIDWISEADNGQSDGLNKAIQRCRGDIIVVLNADDELVPGAASWAVQQLKAHPEVGAVYGDQLDINESGEVISKYFAPEYDFVKMFCVEQIIPAQAAFIRRECLESVGWHADVSRATCPDYEMWVRLGLKHPMLHVPGFVARYRRHANSQGCQTSWIDEMVRSKREVMERVFSDQQAPISIRRLRRRANAGVYWWSADMFLLEQGQVGLGLARAFRALAVLPHPRLLRRLPGFLLAALRISLRAKKRRKNEGVAGKENQAASC